MRQLQMWFLESPADSVAPVWPTLDPAQREVVVSTLARLIAKAIERDNLDEEESDDE
jgi:hypothetical protein